MAQVLAAATPWSPDKKHSDRERWICVYPAYINNKKTIAEGRVVSKAQAVENPTYQEIRDVLAAAGMRVGVENKLYSRECSKEMTYIGRIRVQIKHDDGTVINPNFPTRKSILIYLGEMIPKLKSRIGKQNTGGDSQSQSSGGAKKKGKGKR